MLGLSILTTLMGSAAPLFLLQGMDVPTERIARGAVHAAVLGARSAMDLQYDGIVYDEKSMAISLRGVVARPPVGADLVDCVVEAEAMTLTPSILTDAVGLQIEADDITASSGCAAEVGMVATAMFGADALTADRASVDIDYAMGRSALTLTAYLQTAKTGTVDAALTASGLHVMAGEPDEEGYPGEDVIGGTLDAFEMTVDDIDRLRGLLPMLGIEGDPTEEAVATLRDGMGEVAETPAGEALIDSAETEIARFLADGGALSVRMTADEPVPLSTLTEMSGPEDAISLLQPILASRPHAGETIFVWETPDAMAEQIADFSDDEKRALAHALATGQGIPRSRAKAADIYVDLAAEGDADAALSAAMLLMERDPVRAYELALDAGAANAKGARLTLDRIEKGIAFETVLQLQRTGDEEPVADMAELRLRARAALDGQGARRSYADALFNASLAAAAGDRASATLYDRLVARFEEDEKWSDVVHLVSDRAMEAWTAGRLGVAFADKP